MNQPPGLPPEGTGGTGGIIPLTQKSTTIVTPSGLGDSEGRKAKMRSFAQIIAEEKTQRNIIEIKMTKLQIEEDGVMKPAKILTMEEVSVLLFDVIGVKPQECLGVALYTSRYDTKEVKLKPGVDASPYLTKDSPINFKNHEVVVTRQTANVTRVTFRNVPFNIPDEEVINLCECYGEIVDNVVMYEKPTLNSRGVMGSTRYVDMKLTPGKQLENFYWMEGPLEGDRGCRITVLHSGQEKQCSNCLRREGDCPGGGVGKVCVKMGTPRGLMADYMKHLQLQHKYLSLKMKFQEMEFPLLGGRGKVSDGFGHIIETEKEDEEVQSAQEPGFEVDQSKLKNDRIAELEVQLEETKAKLAEKNSNTWVIPQQLFDYDEDNDSVIIKDETGFDKFLDEKCRARVNRDKRKADMKNKMLDQVKQFERRKRNLSVGSQVSLTFLDSPSRRRGRSTDSTDGDRDGADSKHSRLSQNQSAIS